MTRKMENCRKCGAPSRAEGTGTITQWLSTCACDNLPMETEKRGVCAKCDKRLPGSQGTLTQWIIRPSVCNCSTAKPGVVEVKDIQATALTPQKDKLEEEELELNAEVFPKDRYKPLAEIGKGASGTIYLCRDRLLGKKVAVKCLRHVTGDHLIQFQREAKATGQLKHPSIVAVMDLGSAPNGAPYMVMEFVRGMTLKQYIGDNGPLPLNRVLRVFGRIAGALSYAHAKSVFHRDLSSSNILIVGDSADPEVRLIDFGVATIKQAIQEPTIVQGQTIVGTPAYMPPDQVHGLAFDERSEVYSLGCVMFEALTGTPPYAGETAMDIITQHAHEPVPLVYEFVELEPEIQDAVQQFFESVLAKDPDDRFQSMTELEKAIEALIDPKAERPVGTPEFNKKSVSSGWMQSVSICVLLLGFAAITVLYMYKSVHTDSVNLPSVSFGHVNERLGTMPSLRLRDVANDSTQRSNVMNDFAWMQLSEGEDKLALKNALDVVQQDPTNMLALDTCGVAYFLNGQPQNAIQVLSRVVQNTTGSTRSAAYFHRGVVQNSLGKNKLGKNDFKLASASLEQKYRPSDWERKRFKNWMKDYSVTSTRIYHASTGMYAYRISEESLDLLKPKNGNRTTLYITDSTITKTMWDSICRLADEEVYLVGCEFDAGAFSTSLLRHTKYLRLDHCTIPPLDRVCLSRDSSLRTLTLAQLQWQDDEFAYPFSNQRLRTLDIQECRQFTGNGLFRRKPQSLLVRLDISHCPVSDSGLIGLQNCKELEYLRISRCSELSGTGLTALSRTKLKHVVVEKSSLTDKGLLGLAALPSLRTLRIERCGKATGLGLAALANLQLQELDWAGQDVSKYTFTSIAKLKTLKQLSFQSSPSGAVSSGFSGYSTSIGTANRFPTGSISKLAALPQLGFLGLDCDRIASGTYEELISLRSLKVLYLAGLTWIPESDLENISRLKIRGLVLVNNVIGPNGWEVLSRLQKLETLILNQTKVTDYALEDLVKLNLRSLLISGGAVSDHGLTILARMSKLQAFAYSGIRFSEKAVRNFRMSVPRCKIRNLSSYR